MVNCPYKGNCKSEGYKCFSCQHNSDKKDYYKPAHPYDYYDPYVVPWEEPWYRYPTIICCRTTG